jgi:hypothetical protein
LKERIADTEVSATSFVICAKCRNAWWQGTLVLFAKQLNGLRLNLL